MSEKHGGGVLEVTDKDFGQLLSGTDKLVMVDFWATWCAPCVALGPTLEALAQEHSDRVVLAKINIEQNQKVAGQFRITSIPTVLFFKDGKPVNSVVGVRPKGFYTDLIDKHG